MANDVEDKYTNLGRSQPDEGEPVDYDPFPEDKIALAMESIEKLCKVLVSSEDKRNASLNNMAQASKELARALKARREVVRDANGRLLGIKIIH